MSSMQCRVCLKLDVCWIEVDQQISLPPVEVFREYKYFCFVVKKKSAELFFETKYILRAGNAMQKKIKTRKKKDSQYK